MLNDLMCEQGLGPGHGTYSGAGATTGQAFEGAVLADASLASMFSPTAGLGASAIHASRGETGQAVLSALPAVAPKVIGLVRGAGSSEGAVLGVTKRVVGEEAGLYETGTYNQLARNRVKDTVIHHVPSRLRGKELVPTYPSDRMAGPSPAIRLPGEEAAAVDRAATLRTQIPDSARQEVAWQIRDLRNNTNAPNSALQDLINLIKTLYEPDMNVKGNQ
jgi:hypothetical protein